MCTACKLWRQMARHLSGRFASFRGDSQHFRIAQGQLLALTKRRVRHAMYALRRYQQKLLNSDALPEQSQDNECQCQCMPERLQQMQTHGVRKKDGAYIPSGSKHPQACAAPTMGATLPEHTQPRACVSAALAAVTATAMHYRNTAHSLSRTHTWFTTGLMRQNDSTSSTCRRLAMWCIISSPSKSCSGAG